MPSRATEADAAAALLEGAPRPSGRAWVRQERCSPKAVASCPSAQGSVPQPSPRAARAPCRRPDSCRARIAPPPDAWGRCTRCSLPAGSRSHVQAPCRTSGSFPGPGCSPRDPWGRCTHWSHPPRWVSERGPGQQLRSLAAARTAPDPTESGQHNPCYRSKSHCLRTPRSQQRSKLSPSSRIPDRVPTPRSPASRACVGQAP